MVTYLTGGSGYLGGEIVRALALNERSANDEILIPVRDKRGKTGQERFDALFSDGNSLHKHLKWVAPEDPIPDDTEVVILNAFDVAFHKDIGRVLRESVAPTLALLEQCSKLSLKCGNLQKVIVVSTAYVQPPLPYRRCDGPITPFNGAADPWALYSKLLKGEMDWQDLVDCKDNDPHFTTNAYIYAKTLLEHLIATFTDLPRTYIVRPSVIGPSSCGTRGNPASPGCASARLMGSPVGRFMPSSGCSDNIFVDDVSRRIVQVVTDELPSGPAANPLIVWATNGLPASYQTIEACVNPRKWLITPPAKWLNFCVRIEGWLTRLIMGQKAKKALLGFYRSYTYFTTNTFDFQQVSPTTPKMFGVACVTYLAMLKAKQAEKKKQRLKEKEKR